MKDETKLTDELLVQVVRKIEALREEVAYAAYAASRGDDEGMSHDL